MILRRTMSSKVLTLKTINPNIVNLEYAVRGPLPIRAVELENELKQKNNLPFNKVIKCNIGDCHATGQRPITFLRQLAAATALPSLLDNPEIPEDVKSRANRILSACEGHSIGSYSVSTGVVRIKQDVAAYIEARDGLTARPENIFLSSGASEAVKSVLQLISTQLPGKQRAGIMVPIPQYPLYSATNAEYNACQINYYLDEDRNWGLAEAELEKALSAHKEICVPRAIVVINPGNPTGQVLTKEDIQMVIRFAARHRLVILADEVYQFNVYAADRQFHSFKKTLHDLGEPIASSVELASFMSVSKGYMGECGLRGGYCELVNFDPDVKAQLFKALSARLCSSVIGQTMVEAVVNPPTPNEPSFKLFIAEKTKVLDDLKKKAQMVTTVLNSMKGFKCNAVQGAMYAFPQLSLPAKAIAAAKAKGQAADFLYCWELLESTGVCVIPGSGFGQRDGTFHFRMTILPPVDVMSEVMEKIQKFHADFLKRYE